MSTHHAHETARTLADMQRRIEDLERADQLPYTSTESEDLDLIKFHEDEFVLKRAGAQDLKLTYKPLPYSDYLYWQCLYQEEGVGWTRTGKTVSLTGVPAPAKKGDIVTVEYAYLPGADVPDTEPPYVPVPPVLSAAAGWDLPRDTMLTSLALPAGTQVGDIVVVNAIGGFGGDSTEITDSRMTRVAHHTTHGIGPGGRIWGVWVGYADTLDPLAVQMKAQYSPMGQFAKGTIMAVRGDGDYLEWDPARVAVSPIYNSGEGFMPAVPGHGSGAIASVLGSHSGQLTGSWQSPAMDPYAPAKVTIGDSGTIAHMGYADDEYIDATLGPPSTAGTAWQGVVIGFK